MRDREHEAIERFAAALREAPVPIDSAARARLDAALQGAPPPRGRLPLGWLTAGALPIAPLLAAGLAGLLIGVGVATAVVIGDEAEAPAALAQRDGATTNTPVPDSTQAVQFLFVAPTASQVALVGDFNEWDAAATPMEEATAGVWTVRVPLRPGRHLYAFVVDGARWAPDPAAPLAPEDGFGTRNSVVIVGGSAS